MDLFQAENWDLGCKIMILKATDYLKLKDFSQPSQFPQELTLLLKFWENLTAESKVRSYGVGEENFEKSGATSDTDRNTCVV